MVTYKQVIEYYKDKPQWMDNTNRYMKNAKVAGDYEGLANRFVKRKNGESIKKARDDEFVYFVLNHKGFNESWDKINEPIIKNEGINQKWHLLISYISYGLFIAERIRSNPNEDKKWTGLSKIQSEEVTFDYYKNAGVSGCKCPELMLWMAEAAGHERIMEATDNAINMYGEGMENKIICKELLNIITWDKIERKIDA